MVLSTVFYYFSRSLYQFAADLTGGIDASGVAISPSRIVDKVRGAINFAILVARAALKDPSAKKELEQKVKEEVQSAAPKAPGGDGGSAPKAPGSPAPRGGIGK
jgi:type IV secretory pathway VirB6-like protein